MAIRWPQETRPAPEDFGRTAADALHQAEQLIRAEFALAKSEVYQELRVLAGAGAALVGALMLAQCALFAWGAALILWFGAGGWAAAIVGLAFALLAGASTFAGVTLITRRHLSRTRGRLQRDARTLAESSRG